MNSDNSHTDEPQQKSFLQVVVHSFFIIPFLIAVFCVLLFGSMHLLTRESKTVFDYLDDVKVGGKTRRWQGAYELTRFLSRSKILPKDPRFLNELESVFRDAKNDDPRVRQYLALAMGRTGHRDFVNVLVEALREGGGSPEAVIYALGLLEDPVAGEAILPFLEDSSPRIRSISVVALGSLEGRQYAASLETMLHDEEPNVRWGAAVALAHKGSPAGETVLLDMLSRDYWSRFPQVDREEANQMIRMALAATARLDERTVFLPRIRELAGNDSNIKIRGAAMDWMKADDDK